MASCRNAAVMTQCGRVVLLAMVSHRQLKAFELCIRPDGEPEGTLRVDEGSDSSEDERPPRNTVGEVPLQWYNDEQHIGYDRDAKKLIKRTRKDKLETLLAQTDTKQGFRTIYDEYNDEEIVLSKDELRMIQRIRQGQFPDVEVTPFFVLQTQLAVVYICGLLVCLCAHLIMSMCMLPPEHALD